MLILSSVTLILPLWGLRCSGCGRVACLPASLTSLLACGRGPGTRSELGVSHCGLVRECREPKRESRLCCDCSNGLWKRGTWRGRRTEWNCPLYVDRRRNVIIHAVAFFFPDSSECKCLLFSFSQVGSWYVLWIRMLLVEAASDHLWWRWQSWVTPQ